jgi:hypothetical protein
MFGRILSVAFAFLVTVSSAQAQVVPDLTPIKCAWSQFTPERQKQLRDSYVVDNSGDSRVLQHQKPGIEETRAAANACTLNYTPTQLEDLRGALGYKSNEELARMGIEARGLLKPDIVDRAVAKLNDHRRSEIGDGLACSDGVSLKRDWDRALVNAMRRTGIRIVDGRTVALIAIAMYGVVAQEGYMRRINGTAPPCDD